MQRLVENLVVDEDRMLGNLESTRGLVYSQAVLLALIDSGLTRDEAYRLVQRNAMTTWDDGGTLIDHLLADPDVILDPTVLESCFAPKQALANTAVIFNRLTSTVLA
jgi:adenylosuccinate lyase